MAEERNSSFFDALYPCSVFAGAGAATDEKTRLPRIKYGNNNEVITY